MKPSGLFYLFPFLWGVIAIQVSAQVPDELDLYEDIPIVISATMTLTSYNRAPSTIEVFSKNDLEETGTTTMQELLRTATGVDLFFVQSWRSAVNIRGIGDFGEGALFIDQNNVVLNRSTSGHVELDQLISLGNIQRVEIIRGPGSALYGANAFAGLIRLVPADFSDDLKIGAFVSQGNYDSRELDLTINSPRVQAEIGHSYSDGYHGNAINDQDILESYSGAVRGKLARDITVYANYTKHRFGISGSNLPVVGSRNNFDNHSFGIQWTRELAKNLVLNSNAYIQTYDSTLKETNSLNTIDEHRKNLKSWLDWTPAENHQVLFGGEFRAEETDSTDLNPTKNESDNQTAFAQWGSQYKERVSLTLGARLDNHSVYGNHFSPRTSLSYNAGKIWLRTSFGHAFRAPTFQNLYLDNEVFTGIFIRGDENLKAEELETLELSLGINQFRGLSVELTLFHTDAKDLITSETNTIFQPNGPPTIIIQLINRDRVESEGVEFNFRYKTTEWWKLRGNISLQNPILKGAVNEQPLPNTTEKKASLAATFSHGNRMSLALTGLYTGPRAYVTQEGPVSSQAELKAYDLWNAFFRWRLRQGLHLSLKGENLFDKVYSDSFKQPGKPRTYAVGFHWRK